MTSYKILPKDLNKRVYDIDEAANNKLSRQTSYNNNVNIKLNNLLDFTIVTQQFINNINPEDFIHIYEVVTHDGYDVDGPCSNLFDLFIIVHRPIDNYDYFFYHAEEWFTPNEVIEYRLEDSFTSIFYDPFLYNNIDWNRIKNKVI
jgi:hypothetical protein